MLPSPTVSTGIKIEEQQNVRFRNYSLGRLIITQQHKRIHKETDGRIMIISLQIKATHGTRRTITPSPMSQIAIHWEDLSELIYVYETGVRREGHLWRHRGSSHVTAEHVCGPWHDSEWMWVVSLNGDISIYRERDTTERRHRY